ncbi:MAG TPA: 3'(2'),5'-bisphosphate nucleotidase CysQ [Blastocatellia bacterium]|nr:3'(2'),5'-bisphosphate nucleotidase CysQ [Blastocatellia bacterium]
MNLSHELATAKRLALEAGRVLLEFYDLPADIELKAGAEPVTAADKAANQRIVEGLMTAFPDDGILAEETPDTANRLDRDRLWVVDPMDGTKEFIKKNGEFSVMIGLAVDGRPVVGVVYQPTLGRMFSATAGCGAALEVEGGPAIPLTVSDVADTRNMAVAISRSHRSERIDSVRQALGIEREVRSGSVGLKIGLICERHCDLYIHPSPHTKQWDACAPEAILVEAGGRMTDLEGNAFVYNRTDLYNRNGILATNGRAHDEILERVSAVFAG